MPRLITFGSLSLFADDGSTRVRIRPQRLAILAVFAAAAPRGVTRERLLGLFWPDSDEEDARHSLRQALYALRQEFGRDPVRATGADLALDRAVLRADITEFRAAIAAGERARAADLVSGPFLDGFYLSNAPEFERWVEDERGRLNTQVAGLLEVLAREAETAGDRDAAVTRRRQLTSLDPVSGRYALAYMKALSVRGDRAEALAFARTHEAVVRRELEADPDPQVQQLVRELRAMPVPEAPARPAARRIGDAHATAQPILAEPAGIPITRSRVRRFLIPTAVVVALAIGFFALYRATRAAPSPVLAVGHVAEAGVPDSLRIGGVLTDMLATNLGRIEGLSVLANSRVLEMMPPRQEISARGYTEAARRAGASEIIEGRLLPGPAAGLALELSRVDLRRGLVRNAYRVTAVDRYALVDSATAAIGADLRLAIPAGSVAEATTGSPIAYRFYEEGLRAYYQFDAPAAYRLLRAAMDEDPEFVMATYYASLSAISAAPDSVEPLLRRAQALAARSPERVRHLIAARYLWLTQEARALAVAETLAVLLPDDPEAQRLVGNIRGFNQDYSRAVAAYERAVALDSATLRSASSVCRLCGVLAELSDIYHGWDSLPAAEGALRRWVRLRPDDPNGWLTLAGFLERAGRWEEARLAWREASSLGRSPNREETVIAMTMQGLYDDAERALSSMLSSPRPETRGWARWYLLIVLRNRGRLREAYQLSRGGAGGPVNPAVDTLPPDLLNGGILAFETGRFLEAAEQFHTLSRGYRTDRFPGRRARNVSWYLTLAATAYEAAGDTARVRAIADTIAQIAPQSLYGRDRGLPLFLRGLLATRQGRHEEAVGLMRQAVSSWTFGYTRVNYELAKSLLALNRAEEAVAVLQPALRGGLDGSNLYITRTELHELLAQAWDATGQRDSARVHWAEADRAWASADPIFRVRWETAHRLARR